MLVTFLGFIGIKALAREGTENLKSQNELPEFQVSGENCIYKLSVFGL